MANGGDVNRPLIALALLSPSTPDSEQIGFADVSKSTVVLNLGLKNTVRSLAIPSDILQPIVNGLTRVITGPGVDNGSYHATTGERLFASYPYEDLPIAGKTGTAQGAASLPWNDSSAFAAFSTDATRPIVVSAYLEKAGYGAKAAAPVVKCMFMAAAGAATMDPVAPSNPLNTDSLVAAPERRLPSTRCLGGAAYGGRD